MVLVPRPFGISLISLILLLSLIWRVIFSYVLPLGTDEAYALAVGRSFSLSFFDHPPLGFWAPALAEDILGAISPLGYRTPNLFLGTLSVWLLYLCGRQLGGEVAGLWTAILATFAPFMTFSGIMILPDGPLYAGLAGALYSLIRLAQGEENKFWLWVFGGTSLAVALASKYQAGLLPISLLIWLVFTRRAWVWLFMPGFWVAMLISLLGILPVMLWNINHDWASFNFHRERVGDGLNLLTFGFMIAAQALYIIPVIFIWSSMRLLSGDLWRDAVSRLLLLIALAPIAMFNLIYLFDGRSLPHWSMPGWMALLPLVGVWLSCRPWASAQRWLLGLTLSTHFLLMAIAVHVGNGTFTNYLEDTPNWDNTVPLIPMARTRQALEESGYLEGADLLAASSWIEAGHIGAAMGSDWPMRVLQSEPHHFAFMSGHALSGEARLIGIARLNDQDAMTKKLLTIAQTLDPTARLIGVVILKRGLRSYFALPVIAFLLESS